MFDDCWLLSFFASALRQVARLRDMQPHQCRQERQGRQGSGKGRCADGAARQRSGPPSLLFLEDGFYNLGVAWTLVQDDRCDSAAIQYTQLDMSCCGATGDVIEASLGCCDWGNEKSKGDLVHHLACNIMPFAAGS